MSYGRLFYQDWRRDSNGVIESGQPPITHTWAILLSICPIKFTHVIADRGDFLAVSGLPPRQGQGVGSPLYPFYGVME